MKDSDEKYTKSLNKEEKNRIYKKGQAVGFKKAMKKAFLTTAMSVIMTSGIFYNIGKNSATNSSTEISPDLISIGYEAVKDNICNTEDKKGFYVAVDQVAKDIAFGIKMESEMKDKTLDPQAELYGAYCRIKSMPIDNERIIYNMDNLCACCNGSGLISEKSFTEICYEHGYVDETGNIDLKKYEAGMKEYIVALKQVNEAQEVIQKFNNPSFNIGSKGVSK